MKSSKGPAPGFINDPAYSVRITASDERWIARLGDLVLADSSRTQVLKETGIEAVIYFPPADVSMSHLVQVDDRTTCPFKGEARYYVNAAAEDEQPIAWTYPSVFDEVLPISGHIAFYKNQVELKNTLSITTTHGARK